jgi:hypothetical protein
MLQTPQIYSRSGHTSVFSDASTNLQDRIETVLHVPSIKATPLGTAHPEMKH